MPGPSSADPSADPSGGQSALDLRQVSGQAAERFIPAPSNARARAWLARDSWPEGRLWLRGAEGTGKTHLLRGWARARGVPVLDARDAGAWHAGAWRADSADLAIDNLDSLSDEAALLHLLNDMRSRGGRVLMAARDAPSRMDFALPDLASRLRATATAEIREAEDALRATLLLALLARRQLVVPRTVTDWLGRHLPRTGGALVAAVERLDAAAMARGGPITRALAEAALADLLRPEE